MGYAATRSAAVTGVTGHLIEVQADATSGVGGLHLIGLPDTTAWPTRDRVRAAVINSGIGWPDQPITVNVGPADHAAACGPAADLAIAVAVLAATGHIRADRVGSVVFLGELGLDGTIRPVRGVLPCVGAAARAGITTVVVPATNATEAAQAPGLAVIPAETLADLAAWLRDGDPHTRAYTPPPRSTQSPASPSPSPFSPPSLSAPGPPTIHASSMHALTAVPVAVDLADVGGNHAAHHALEVCAAGGHHLFLIGDPDSPARMLAERLPGILPPLDGDAVREVTEIYSVAGGLSAGWLPVTVPPMNAPHHTITAAAMFGGGTSHTRPGAVTLAHRGLLFLDEAPEFPRQLLDGLRQIMDTGQATIAGTERTVSLPARFLLVMAAHRCPCTSSQPCPCTPTDRRRYLNRLAALLDRVDVRAELQPSDWRSDVIPGESSAHVAARVLAARQQAAARLAGTPWRTNAEVPALELRTTFPATPDAIDLLRSATASGQLTPARFTRVLRVAWTLADLRGATRPARQDAAAALDLWKGSQP